MSSCKSDRRCVHGVSFDNACPYCSYEHSSNYTEKTTMAKDPTLHPDYNFLEQKVMAAPDKHPDSTDTITLETLPELEFDEVSDAQMGAPNKIDMVNHPPHYTQHPSGIECIQITEHMGFNLGNALKYTWRADLKDDAIEDMRKAIWYLQREIDKREKNNCNEDASYSCADRVTALDN